VYAIFGDAETSRYLDDDTLTKPDEALEIIDWVGQIFADKRGLRWGITIKNVDAGLIGTCGFNVWYPPLPNGSPGREGVKADIGYDLARPYWRQGIMSEALHAMLDFGFTQMALHRIEAQVEPGNVASAALLNKLGFQREGLLRDYGYWRGSYQDIQLFSLLRRDWKIG
jgi:ribosomal-protein-alanine N-acetyltransferase